MHKFFEDTIQSRFIKALLLNTPLPIYKTIKSGDYVVKNNFYIHDNRLFKCTKSGKYGTDECRLEFKDNYVFGKKYTKYTDNFISPYRYYDSKTHERLGDYLRNFRDAKGIDLMPFYNCFSNSFFPGLKITQTNVIETVSNEFKMIKIPIRFNRAYTIAIDSISQVSIASAFISDENLIFASTEDEINFNVTGKFLESHPDAIKILQSTSYRAPFTYRVENKNVSDCELYEKFEKNLYMLIQIPAINTSTITVLEGDYVNVDSLKVVSFEKPINRHELNNLILSNLSLLRFSDGQQYPYADRLIEYLLDNVITNQDQIDENILRTQTQAGVFSGNEDSYIQFIPDVWNDEIRYALYEYIKYNEHTINKIDINGFVDKELENLLVKRGVK